MFNVSILNVIILNVIMLNAIMLNVIMLNLVMVTLVMLTTIVLTVILLYFIKLTASMRNVIKLRIVMLIALAPFKPLEFSRDMASKKFDGKILILFHFCDKKLISVKFYEVLRGHLLQNFYSSN